MPRGAAYAGEPPQSDNPIEVGETQVHGAGNDVKPDEPPARAHKTAGMPEGMSEMDEYKASGGGSRGNQEGSGKGGHEPHTDGSGKGLGAHKGNENLDVENVAADPKIRQGKGNAKVGGPGTETES